MHSRFLMRLRSLVLVAAVSATGCLPAKRPPIYRVDQHYAIDLGPAEIHGHPDAARAFADATTVAFVPPATCAVDVAIEVDVDVEAAPAPAALVCASAVARLEAAALRAGLNVVTWRALAGDAPMVERAAAAGVDVLFVLDELTAGVPPHELYGAATTAVASERDGHAVALRDPGSVAARCAAALAPALAPELAVVLDAQLVEVATGRVLWTYRRTQHPAGALPALQVSRRYTATVGARPEGVADWKVITGSIGVSLGAPVLLATSIVDTAGDADPPDALYGAGIALLGYGIYSLVTMNDDAHWRYGRPDDVVCHPHNATLFDELSARDWPLAAPSCDGRCRRALDQVDAAVADLFAHLAHLRAAAPP